jgi:hypothetical protein
MKTFFLTNLFFTILAFPFFGQVGTPFSITSTDTNICVGQSTNLSVDTIPGKISALACASTINSGNLFSGVTESSRSSSIPYSGGNGGLHNG